MTAPSFDAQIFDDSAVVRQPLIDILSADPAIGLITSAFNLIFAAIKIKQKRPDVVTHGVEMPRMDGLSFLKQIIAEDPVPVLMSFQTSFTLDSSIAKSHL